MQKAQNSLLLVYMQTTASPLMMAISNMIRFVYFNDENNGAA